MINYYLKSETYTKSEVDNLLSAVSSLDIEVVQTLPTQDISTSTIYLVPKTSSTNDNYDEYIYVSNSWEHIGSTEVDLSNYATKTEVMTLLNHFAEYIFEQVGNAETVVVIPYPVGIGYGADEGYGTGPITRYQYTDTSVIELLDDIYAMYNQAASNSSNQINKDVYIKLMYTEGSSSFCTGFAKLTNVVFNPTDIRNHGNWDILLEFVSTEWDNNSSYDEFRYKIYGDIDDSIWSTSYLKSKTFTENLYEEIDGDISDLETSVSSKQDNLVSGTNIKTINNESILGSGNINISAGGGTMVDMRVNGSSVVDSNNVGNIATEGTYNASTNKIATMADMPLLGNAKTYYGTCSTASEAAEKEVNCSGFILETGAIITVIFTYGNKYNGTATLNVNNTGAKSIMRNLGSTATRYYWNNNEAIDFVYNGSSYVMIRTGTASSTYYGLTKLNNSVDSSSGIEAATPYAVKQAYDLANSKQSKITSSNKLDYSLIDNTPTIPTKVSDLTNDSGFITSYTETDPVFSASAASGITSSDITNWNNKSDFSGSYNDLTDLPVETDIRINNSSIISGGVANLGVSPDYNSSTNPLATMKTVSQGMNAVTSLINRKQDTLVSGTNIKTINGDSILGSGNISVGGEKVPIGTIFEFPTDDATKLPTGYLFCDGSAVSRTQYADLFAVIGTTWGSGDGSTTFNLPSKEGLVTVGIDSNDTSFDTIGETGGSKELQAHNHDIRYQNPNGSGITISHTGSGLTALDITGWAWNNNTANSKGSGSNLFTNTEGTGDSGNLQPYVVSNYIIKAANVSQLPDAAEVVDGYSTSTTDAYSANYVNNTLSTLESNVVMQPTVLYSNTSGTYDGITLNESVVNYSAIEIYFHTNDGAGFRGCQKVHVSSGTTIASLQYIHTVSGNYYIKARQVNIVGNQITNNHSKEIYSGGMSDNNTILIDKVLGYK